MAAPNATIAPAGYLQKYAGRRNDHFFEVVGYGLQRAHPVFEIGGDTRMKAEPRLLNLESNPPNTYIQLSNNPTTGGIYASFATQGDIILAEPEALIGFAGPRVIENTVREKLPEGFQRAEYLLAHGMIDMVVPRHQLRERLSQLVAYLAPETKAA